MVFITTWPHFQIKSVIKKMKILLLSLHSCPPRPSEGASIYQTTRSHPHVSEAAFILSVTHPDLKLNILTVCRMKPPVPRAKSVSVSVHLSASYHILMLSSALILSKTVKTEAHSYSAFPFRKLNWPAVPYLSELTPAIAERVKNRCGLLFFLKVTSTRNLWWWRVLSLLLLQLKTDAPPFPANSFHQLPLLSLICLQTWEKLNRGKSGAMKEGPWQQNCIMPSLFFYICIHKFVTLPSSSSFQPSKSSHGQH